MNKLYSVLFFLIMIVVSNGASAKNVFLKDRKLDYWGTLVLSEAPKYSESYKGFFGIEIGGALGNIVLSFQTQSNLNLNYFDDVESPSHRIMDLSIGRQLFRYNGRIQFAALIGIGEVSFSDKEITLYDSITNRNEFFSNTGLSIRLVSKYWAWENASIGLSLQRIWDGNIDPIIYSVSFSFGSIRKK